MNQRRQLSTSYFASHYGAVQWPLETPDTPGLRRAQAGALHAVAAHFSRSRSDAAIITMPTGSGKTAVLCAAPYLLRSRRVLVLTPSRLVREQTVDEFRNLTTLRAIGVLSESVPAPQVFGAAKRISSRSDWEDLRQYDVIIGTPHSLSPRIETIPDPPSDLFDVVLVDEAHHSPAETWRTILSHFSGARQVLFTATPFRTDRKALPGSFAYTYDLKEAFDDEVFGTLEYQPVRPSSGEDVDLALAKAVAKVVRGDREQGLHHLAMIRTGAVKRAKELLALYTDSTDLRLDIITGASGLRHMRAVVGKLEAGDLDGIVCVDMLGEGFNLPGLKIAALHTPHRSLAVTLQFIGRFARTTGPHLGRATFLALPNEMAIESQKLFQEGAVWQDIIQGVSGARIAAEQRRQEVLSTFEETAPRVGDLPDLSLYALRPFLHVKILNAGPDLDLTRAIDLPNDAEVVHRHVSTDHSTVVYVARERHRPRWATTPHLDSVHYELFILHWHHESGLLFICSSRREDDVYAHFAEVFAPDGEPELRGVSPVRLNRILRGLTEQEFFNIGMRSAAAANREMSYKTVVGSAVDQSVEMADARGFYRGHWFGKAIENGRVITIGLSAGSKVWSNTGAPVSELIDWCDRLAEKIADDTSSQALSGLDRLSIGEEVAEIPKDVIFVDWPKEAYTHPRVVRYRTDTGSEHQVQLLDLDISVDPGRTNAKAVELVFGQESLEFRATFSYETDRLIEKRGGQRCSIRLEPGGPDSFLEFLNEHLPVFYTADLATLEGFSYFRAPPVEGAVFDPQRIETRNWSSLRVDTAVETGPSAGPKKSIHAYLESELMRADVDVVLYDHGKGEIADFLTVTAGDRDILIELYHCKASQGAPASRVKDLYEVCGQAIKSHNWRDRRRVLAAIRNRVASRGGKTRFIKGDLDTAAELLSGGMRPMRLRVVIVQPGLSRAGMSDSASALLAAVDEFVYGGRAERMRIIGSE